MRIDVHAHYYPNEYVDCFARQKPEARGSIARAPGARLTLDERLAVLDKVGIDLQVLSLGALVPYFVNAAEAVETARLGNDLYVEVCNRYRGRFAAFATVPLPHVEEAIAEVERCLDKPGMLGVTVGCSVGERTLDDPAFGPFFADLNRRRAVLFLHPMGVGGALAPADYGLNWLIGAPFENTVAALRLILSGTMARYPNIRILLPHLGGTLPFLLQRLDDVADLLAAVSGAARIEGKPSTYVRRFWFDTVSSHPAALRCARESIGADHLVLGTDFPYMSGPKLERCVTYVEEAGLPAGDAEAILSGNARALLGLDSGSPERH